ncbi:SPRY domain-containing protein 7b [Hemibagrus wyckioides]|uniref:SPRY domain-containing protein 7b n=1 Tax=Hemibagrus wyckioides TaxID=337641 RepID=UPI00266C5C9B|nr:SPRY domain-containing protein 7b [Hemibagrus wyckioides]
MAAMFTSCLCCCSGDGGSDHKPLNEMPTVQLDTHHMGADVVVVKRGRRVCGRGACLGSAPLHQNESYFEFKVQSTAYQCVLLTFAQKGLVLRHDGSVYHNNEEKNCLPANNVLRCAILPHSYNVVRMWQYCSSKFILFRGKCGLKCFFPKQSCLHVFQGLTYDHVELNLYLNGKNMQCPASGIRGTVFPVVYVDDSAIIDCQFSDFYYTPPQGCEKILFEQQIF